MASSPYLTDRAMGLWGPRAYAWTGEAPPCVLGFPYQPSEPQRMPVSPPDPPPPPPGRHWFRGLALRHSRRGHQPGTS